MTSWAAGTRHARHVGPPARMRLAAARRWPSLPPMGPDPRDPASRRAYYGIEVPAASRRHPTRARWRACTPPCWTTSTASDCSSPRHARRQATTPQTDGLPGADRERDRRSRTSASGSATSSPRPACPGSAPASFGHTGAGGRLGIADPGPRRRLRLRLQQHAQHRPRRRPPLVHAARRRKKLHLSSTRTARRPASACRVPARCPGRPPSRRALKARLCLEARSRRSPDWMCAMLLTGDGHDFRSPREEGAR